MAYDEFGVFPSGPFLVRRLEEGVVVRRLS